MPPEDDQNIDNDAEEREEEVEETEGKDAPSEKELKAKNGDWDSLSDEEKKRRREEYREKRRSRAQEAAELKAENAKLRKERDEALNKAQTVEEVNKVKAEMDIEQVRFDVLADNGYNPALRRYITATDEKGILEEVSKLSKFFSTESSKSPGDGSGPESDEDKDGKPQKREPQKGDKRPAPKQDNGELKDLRHLPPEKALEEAAKDL